MAQIRVTPARHPAWTMALGAGALAIAAGAWWASDVITGSSPAQGQAVVQVPAGAQASGADAAASEPATVAAQIVAKVVAEQNEAAQEVAQQVARQTDALPPIVGPVKSRPSYVSLMEWSMLQGVAQQSVRPEQELNRLVNFLRFNKKVELYEGLPAQASQRMAMADQLVHELPERVRLGEMDLKESHRLLDVMLQDAVPDGQARAKRQKAEQALLKAAAKAAGDDSVQAAAAMATSSAQPATPAQQP